MASFLFTGSDPRDYAEIAGEPVAIHAEPGESYDLPGDPGDGLWTAGGAAKAPVSTPPPADPPAA